MGCDDRRLTQLDHLHDGVFGGMGDVDHDPEPVHLPNRFPPQIAEPAVEPDAVPLSGIGVGELAVAVVGEGHVAAPELMKLLDAAQVQADGVGVLDADHGHLLAGSHDAAHVVGRVSDLDLVGRLLFRQPVDGPELVHGVLVSGRVAGIIQIALPRVHDEPGHIKAARIHLGQGDLGGEVHRVVLFLGEVLGVDVVVGVEV